jgi:peptidoglycan-associated lipoprotein
MKKNLWLAFALVMVPPVMFFTLSCAKKEMHVQSEPTPQPEVSTESIIQTGETAPKTPPPETDHPGAEATAHKNSEAQFITENIRFEFNSCALSDPARQTLDKKAEYLRAHPDTRVTIEGHCDERGTDGYNMALGKQRADSVKYYLVTMGIGSDRLRTISYGEERPVDRGNNEAAWSRNRRAQFVIN